MHSAIQPLLVPHSLIAVCSVLSWHENRHILFVAANGPSHHTIQSGSIVLVVASCVRHDRILLQSNCSEFIDCLVVSIAWTHKGVHAIVFGHVNLSAHESTSSPRIR